MRRQFIVNTAGTFKTYIHENNRKVVPSSATIRVYKPGGGAPFIDGAAMSVDPDGLLSYGLSQADNGELGIGYMAALTYVHDSMSSYLNLFYDVVRARLAKLITDEDVTAELPQLKENGLTVRGQAEGGTATSIIDGELKRYGDDYFTGGLAYSIDKDETREITDFSPLTGTVTTTPFSSAVSTDKYVITRSYTKEIDRALEKIEERLIRQGMRPELVLDPHDVREAHIYLSVAEVLKGLVNGSGGLWWNMWKEYEKKAEEAIDGISFKYDIGNDGVISGAEGLVRTGNIKAVRG